MRYLQRLINWVWYLRYRRTRPQPNLDEVLITSIAARAESIARNVEKNNAVFEKLNSER